MEILGLPAAVFTNGAAIGLLAAVAMLIFTGRLVPRSTLDDMRADRDNWRAAALAKEEARQVEAAQNHLVLNELAATVDRFISALPQPDPRRPRGGGR